MATQHISREVVYGAVVAAHLPHARVVAVPVLHHPFDDLGDVAPGVVADPGAVLVEQVDRVDELAVDVELQLVDRGVADPHRRGVAVPAQVVELDLLVGTVAVDVVEHPQRSESVRPRARSRPSRSDSQPMNALASSVKPSRSRAYRLKPASRTQT